MLSNKNAVITGSTSGIGLGMAEALARNGANVMMNGLGSAKENADAIDRVKSHGTKVLFSSANMLKPAQITRMIESAEKKMGSVDILINNAGIQHVAPIEEFPQEKWDAILGIILTSSFHTIRAALPGMKKRKWGRVINTGSAHSLVASPFKSAYVAAKHGLVGLTRTVALEAAQFGVTVNCISPGYVWTPLVKNQVADTARARRMSKEDVKTKVLLEAQPTKEFVTVEQVAEAAIYLCSDNARQITGSNLSMDGGWTAQ